MRLIELNSRIHQLLEDSVAKGWPNYSVDPVLCMQRAAEFLTQSHTLVAEYEAAKRERHHLNFKKGNPTS
jgi:hypothetical protein